MGIGGGLGGPARPGVNFAGKMANLGAAPYDWGFAKKKKITQAVKNTPHINEGKGTTLVPGTVKRVVLLIAESKGKQANLLYLEHGGRHARDGAAMKQQGSRLA